MLNRPEKTATKMEEKQFVQNETEKWKSYALELEKEIKQIQIFRVNSNVKQKIVQGVELSALSGKFSFFINLRNRLDRFENDLSWLLEPKDSNF
jgi:hypothetical protein